MDSFIRVSDDVVGTILIYVLEAVRGVDEPLSGVTQTFLHRLQVRQQLSGVRFEAHRESRT
ncbi:hypothetical protein [Nocardia wallacei]|uniref:hypothetical protein n=1 Tax=Nocardia wallacei TaxID=480035 RepID=UPI001657498F|nr:hypothetical protein [Nocardia wallacei]